MNLFHFCSPGSQLVQCNLNVAKLFTTFTFHLTTTPSYQLDRLRWITQLWIQIKFKLYKLCGSYTHRFSSLLFNMDFFLELHNVWKCVLLTSLWLGKFREWKQSNQFCMTCLFNVNSGEAFEMTVWSDWVWIETPVTTNSHG